MEFKPRLKIWQGSNRKNTFDPDTFQARSYQHWCYVLKIKGQIVFNDYNYSVTTRGHQGEMRSFLRTELKIKDKNVVFVNQRESLTSGISTTSTIRILALATVRLKSPNKREAYYKEQREIIEKLKNDLKKLKRLGGKSFTNLKDAIVEAQESEKYRLENQRAKSKAARDARKAVVTQFKTQYESLDAVVI